jgi:hypothetical protein
MAPRLSPAGPKVDLDEACAPDRGCRVGSLRCRADKPNASPRSRPRPVPLARKFDRGVQDVSEVASAHSRPEQRVNNVNFVIEVDGVGYCGGDDPHARPALGRGLQLRRGLRGRVAPLSARLSRSAHDRLHDFRTRFALEMLSRVAVLELGPRASWPSWRLTGHEAPTLFHPPYPCCPQRRSHRFRAEGSAYRKSFIALTRVP